MAVRLPRTRSTRLHMPVAQTIGELPTYSDVGELAFSLAQDRIYYRDSTGWRKLNTEAESQAVADQVVIINNVLTDLSTQLVDLSTAVGDNTDAIDALATEIADTLAALFTAPGAGRAIVSQSASPFGYAWVLPTGHLGGTYNNPTVLYAGGLGVTGSGAYRSVASNSGFTGLALTIRASDGNLVYDFPGRAYGLANSTGSRSLNQLGSNVDHVLRLNLDGSMGFQDPPPSPPNGAAGGWLEGTYPNPGVVRARGLSQPNGVFRPVDATGMDPGTRYAGDAVGLLSNGNLAILDAVRSARALTESGGTVTRGIRNGGLNGSVGDVLTIDSEGWLRCLPPPAPSGGGTTLTLSYVNMNGATFNLFSSVKGHIVFVHNGNIFAPSGTSMNQNSAGFFAPWTYSRTADKNGFILICQGGANWMVARVADALPAVSGSPD